MAFDDNIHFENNKLVLLEIIGKGKDNTKGDGISNSLGCLWKSISFKRAKFIETFHKFSIRHVALDKFCKNIPNLWNSFKNHSKIRFPIIFAHNQRFFSLWKSVFPESILKCSILCFLLIFRLKIISTKISYRSLRSV